MNRLFKIIVFLALLTPPLFGQAIPGARVAVPVAPPAAAAVAPGGQAFATLRVGDQLDMRLGGMPAEYAAEFSLQYTVGQDGTINVPLIGEVKAAGFTSTQLERAVQNKLKTDKIFTNPAVIISIAAVARFVAVSGGVRAPQRLQWNPDLTLASSIGVCGGLGDFSSGKGIRIVRDSKVFGIFNLRDIQKDPNKDPRLLPGDQVMVPE